MGIGHSDFIAGSASSSKDTVPPLADDLVWEVAGIAAEIGKNARQTHYLLENGALPARKIGGRWCTSRSALRAFFAAKFAATDAA